MTLNHTRLVDDWQGKEFWNKTWYTDTDGYSIVNCRIFHNTWNYTLTKQGIHTSWVIHHESGLVCVNISFVFLFFLYLLPRLGLGYALVKKFYEHNAIVVALDKRQSYLDALKEEFPNVTTICVDLRDWDETRRLVKSVAPIDHLVNNAAISGTSFFGEVAPEQIDGYDINIK